MEKNRGAKKRQLSAKGPSDSTNDQPSEKSVKKDEAEPVLSPEVMIELKQTVAKLEKALQNADKKVAELTQQLEAEREGRKKDQARFEKLTGKQPKKDPHFFCNKTFILMKESPENADYDMEEMKKQIRERGGRVVEDTKLIPQFDEEYLISDKHSDEYEYIYALARDMPCLSYKWLKECVKVESFLPFDSYKLPAGENEYLEEVYPLPSIRGKLLAGKYIMVHGEGDFKEKWSPVVELLGGKILPDEEVCNVTGDEAVKPILPEPFDILITDDYFQYDVAEQLERHGKEIVTEKWLIESIIQGECLGFDDDEEFRPNYDC